MSASTFGRALVLGVYPSCRGFGWIAFEAPFAAFDWGLAFISTEKNVRSLRHFERLLERLQPEAVVFEHFPPHVSRTHRVRTLQASMMDATMERGSEVAIYPRSDVQACFTDVGARTRQDIAVAVAKQIPALAPRLPRERAAWHTEDRRMALFNAAALVLTHYRLGASRLFEQLKDGS